MGGSGKGVNPEQLFSAGYASCFLGALQAMARKAGKDASSASVQVQTGIGPAADKEAGGFALSVEIKVSGFKDKEVVDAADKVGCFSPLILRLD
jgi:organic hydroperoxide reductase OsmC/OhrA